jgi:hypothetical protein
VAHEFLKVLAPAEEVSPHVPPAPSAEGQAVEGRDEAGRFVAGNKEGKGREKGSRNVATRERLALEAALRQYMNNPVRKAKIMLAIDRLVHIAATAEDDKTAINAIKVLTDKVLATAKQEDAQGDQKAPVVHVVIENLTTKPEKDVTPRVIIEQEDNDEQT